MQVRHFAFAAVIAAALALSTSTTYAKPKKSDKKTYTLDQVNKHKTAALEWLVSHQGPDGQWSLKDFSQHTTRIRASKTHNLQWVAPGEEAGDAGQTENLDVAGTGLVLLCFAGDGYDHKKGEYKEYVRKGILYLRKVQDSSGCFGESGRACMVHDSAVATMAMAELYGLSGDEILKPIAAKGVEYLLNAQNENSGWRYGVKPGESDTQMTGWVLMALKSAELAGIEADYDTAWSGADKFFESVSLEQDGIPRTGYNMPSVGSPRNRQTAAWGNTPDMDAVHVACRLLSGAKGWDTKNKDLKKQAGLFTDNLPSWQEKKVDFAYWYFATLSMYQYGGKDWDKWKDALLESLLENQRGWAEADDDTFESILDEYGSWDAVDPWHPVGGRVWSTVASTLMLQVAARYMRLEDK